MSRRYTAKDMRETADDFENYSDMDESVIADMLRQAADDLEREKKYEYGAYHTNKTNGTVWSNHRHFDSLKQAKRYATPLPDEEVRFVRREIGEWEEVEDVHQDGGAR